MSTSDWRRAAFMLLLLKVAYLGVLYVALRVWPSMDEGQFNAVVQRWPRESGPVFASHFATWDAAHYLYLSEVGYGKGESSCAFYPLWPVLIRGCAPLLRGSHVLTAMVLANALSLAALIFFYCLAAARSGQSAAKWTVIFLTAFPGALHFQFNYTESLFLLLVLLLWWGMEEQRLGWAWLAAVLLPLTRGVGVFAVLPIGWYLVTRKPPPWLVRVASGSLWRRKTQCVSDHEIHEKEASTGEPPVPSGGARDGSVNVPTGNPAAAGSSGSPPVPVGGSPALPPLHRGRLEARSTLARWCWRDFVLLLAPLVGWAGYLGLMWQWTGNPFEGFEAQKHWGVHSVSNLIDVPKFLLGFFEPTEWHAFTGSLLDRCVFILLLYTLPVQWRLDKGLLVWTYMLGVLPAMSGTFTSLTRFASCAFPMFIALGAFLSPECAARSAEGAPATRPSALVAPLPCLRAAVRWGLLAVFVTLHIVLVWRFVNFRWAG